MPITDQSLRTMQKQAERIDQRDSEVPGLVIRKATGVGGKISFRFVYRFGGTKHGVQIGDYSTWSLKAARERARELRTAVDAGRDPQTELERSKEQVIEAKQARAEAVRKAAQRVTFRQMAEAYAASPRGQSIRWMGKFLDALALDFYREIGDRPAEDVTRRDIVQILDRMAKRGAPASAERMRSACGPLFAFGRGRGDLTHDPIKDIPAYYKAKPKERVLDDDEIRLLWKATETARGDYRDGIRLALLTGARLSEVAYVRAEEVSVIGGVWTIPAERSKNKHAHVLPLVGMAADIFAGLVKERPEGPLFVGRDGSATHRTLGEGLVRIIDATEGLADFSLHDLRRTMATRLAKMRVDPFSIGLLLNHRSVTKATITMQHYIVDDAADQKREALEKWDAELRRILGDVLKPPENVGSAVITKM